MKRRKYWYYNSPGFANGESGAKTGTATCHADCFHMLSHFSAFIYLLSPGLLCNVFGTGMFFLLKQERSGSVSRSLDTASVQMYSNNGWSIKLWPGFLASEYCTTWILVFLIKSFWYLGSFKIYFYWIVLVLLRYMLPIKEKVFCCW